MANRPVVKGSFDLTPEFLNALAKKGKNERGKYRVEFAMWYDEERSNDRAPDIKGPISIEGEQGGIKSYGSAWLNVGDGAPSASPSSSAASSSSDDIF
jgi:hypothetical protein